MLHKGFENIYHLKGGILKYLETVPESESLWSGECFVFDQRAAVCNGVTEGNYEFCRSCRHPLSVQDKLHVGFEEGVSCLYCNDTLTDRKRESARERKLQIHLANERSSKHLGYQVPKNRQLAESVAVLSG